MLPAREVATHNGGKRITCPKPNAGVVARARKHAAHTYRSYWSRQFGNIKVHRAVCEAFHGPAPFAGAVVIHVNEDAHDNRPENLRWGTQKENLNAPGFIAYCKTRAAGRNSFAKGGGAKAEASHAFL